MHVDVDLSTTDLSPVVPPNRTGGMPTRDPSQPSLSIPLEQKRASAGPRRRSEINTRKKRNGAQERIQWERTGRGWFALLFERGKDKDGGVGGISEARAIGNGRGKPIMRRARPL